MFLMYLYRLVLTEIWRLEECFSRDFLNSWTHIGLLDWIIYFKCRKRVEREREWKKSYTVYKKFRHMTFPGINVNVITIERKVDNQRWHGDFLSHYILCIFFCIPNSFIIERIIVMTSAYRIVPLYTLLHFYYNFHNTIYLFIPYHTHLSIVLLNISLTIKDD